MITRSLFHVGQHLRGKSGTYRVTKQLSEFVYLAVGRQDNLVVVKSVEGHWRLHNERDVLRLFQDRITTLRPFLVEIEDPATPPAIVLRHLDDDLTRASNKQRLSRQEIKYVAKGVLETLHALHESGYVHTDIKPRNVLVNYAATNHRFSEVQVADCGGTVPVDSQFAKDGVLVGTDVFRAPEVHLELPWNTSADIWSFGVTLINLIWGLNFHIFQPEEPEDHVMYETMIVVHQHQRFGPFPVSYKETADEDRQLAILGIMSAVPLEKMKPFNFLGEREICSADKDFVLKIMKLDPRDRPTAKDLLRDSWLTGKSGRTVGWYSKEEWQNMQKS